MTQQIQCRTLFDITATGVRSHYRQSRIPFRDDRGQEIQDLTSWTKSRNQQRNWETINQIISLRCLPDRITTPRRTDQGWVFDFEVPNIASIERDGDAVGWLRHDATDIPMITGLDETAGVDAMLRPNINIWFSVSDGK